MPSGSRIIVDLNRPIPWQISDRRTEGVITLDAITDSALIERFAPPPLPPPAQIQEAEDAAPVPVVTPSEQPLIRVENGLLYIGAAAVPHLAEALNETDYGPLLIASSPASYQVRAPFRCKWMGRDLGADNYEIYMKWVGMNQTTFNELKQKGVI